METVLDFLRGI